jgi:hypothetical protein
MKLDFEHPDERRVIAGGRVTIDVVHAGAVPVLRIAHAPGWRWSEHSGPESGLARCPNAHVGVITGGSMMVELADGTLYEAVAGDAVAIAPGHDAWTVGDEPAVLVQVDEGAAAVARYGVA